jgi:hypothetical protein
MVFDFQFLISDCQLPIAYRVSPITNRELPPAIQNRRLNKDKNKKQGSARVIASPNYFTAH